MSVDVSLRSKKRITVHCLGKSGLTQATLIISFDYNCMFHQDVRHDYGLTMSQVVKKTIINSIALFGAKNNCVNVIYITNSDESEPSWLKTGLELKVLQFGSALDLFPFSSKSKIGRKRAEILILIFFYNLCS